VITAVMFGAATVAVVQYQRLGDLEAEMTGLATDADRQEEKLQQQAEITTLAIQPGVQRVSMSAVAEPDPPLDSAYGVWLWDENREAHSLAVFVLDASGQAYVPM